MEATNLSYKALEHIKRTAIGVPYVIWALIQWKDTILQV